ncbi:hypothetical protein STIUS_v1c01990 [Spiroplasma sp. TIUS-1]|uniref:Z1 domain-containing protein n=1 Tax=Spiroplasma sp. TIUS-1 TaxID=216963 RepID=UPI00139745B3|nr:Z1 domain-containing protein [Spiroplasma sp. TIUS-1]QHX35754.1 hypothetical protein STIUS_v1c01990 [Spiroplasma sp. TIUS-1]
MGTFLNKFIEIYNNKIGTQGVEEIVDKSNQILEASLKSDGFFNNETGLLVGKVQSGKTSNFLGLSAAAFDNDVDVIFLIGGVDNTLFKQNIKRVKEVFSNVRSKSGISRLCEIKSSNELKNFHSITLEGNKKLIVPVLKNTDHFKYVVKFLEYNKDFFKSKNVIIIDDEGDQGSLDGNAASDKRTNKTKWNQLILKIRSNLEHHLYLTVTATPYANFLLDEIEVLSPNFIKVSKPGKGYMGLNTFHDDNENMIVEVDDDEAEELGIKTESDINWTSPPESLRTAISYFVWASLKKFDINNANEPFEMLVNAKRDIDDHKYIRNLIRGFVNEQIKFSKLNWTDLRFIGTFKDFANLGFKMLFGRKIDIKLDKELLENFCELLNSLNIEMINSSTETGVNIESIKQNSDLVIYVGSDLLGRGITIDKLIVTYITRSAKSKNNADTTLQRARWFGYREKYKDVIKVFMTRKIINFFESISTMEEELWSSLELVDNGNMSIEEFSGSLFLSLPEDLRPARSNIAKTKYVSVRKWQRQNSFFKTSKGEFSFTDIIKTGDDFEYFGQKKFFVKEFKTWDDFSEVSNINNIILEKINLKLSFFKPDSNFFNKKVKVILFESSDSRPYKRSVKELDNSTFFTLFGRGAEKDLDLNNEDKYLGDSNLHMYNSNKDMILIQIHKLNFEFNSKEPIPGVAYALYIPGIEISGYEKSN